MLDIRGEEYRESLSHLTDEAWAYAVQCAKEELEWFPTIAELLDYARRAPQDPRPVKALLTNGNGRVVTRAEGMAIFRAELKRLGVKDPTLPDIEAIIDSPEEKRHDDETRGTRGPDEA